MSLLEGPWSPGPSHLWGKVYEADMNGHSWYLFRKASPVLQPVFPLSGCCVQALRIIRVANSAGSCKCFPARPEPAGPESRPARAPRDEVLSGHSDAASSGEAASPKSTATNLACKLGVWWQPAPSSSPKAFSPATASSAGMAGRCPPELLL